MPVELTKTELRFLADLVTDGHNNGTVMDVLRKKFEAALKVVTKQPRGRQRCEWCRQHFNPKTRGRPPRFCSDSCRQRAYEKRHECA